MLKTKLLDVHEHTVLENNCKPFMYVQCNMLQVLAIIQGEKQLKQSIEQLRKNLLQKKLSISTYINTKIGKILPTLSAETKEE